MAFFFPFLSADWGVPLSLSFVLLQDSDVEWGQKSYRWSYSCLHICIRTSIFLAVKSICSEIIATALVKLCPCFEQPFLPVMTSSSRPYSVLTTCSQLQCMHFSTEWCNVQRHFWIKPSSFSSVVQPQYCSQSWVCG